MISITNTSYPLLAVKNRPFVGWQSIFGPNAVTSSGTPPSGYGVSNVWSPDTYTQWRSAQFQSGDVNDIIISTGSDIDINYVTLVGHNVSDIAGGEVVLQRSSDGSSWTEIDSMTPTNNDPIIFYFDEVGDTFFRLLFNFTLGQVGASDYFYVSHVKAGTALILDRPMFVGMKPNDKRVQKVNNTSDNGKNLGDTLVSVNRLYSIPQQNNAGTFARLYIEDFLDHCELLLEDQIGPMGAFVYAWRPEEYPQDTYYCHAPQSVNRPEYQRPNSMMEWSISGVAEK